MRVIKLWSARLADSELDLIFEDECGKVTEISINGVADSIITVINDDNYRRRIRQALEESYKYEAEEFKVIY